MAMPDHGRAAIPSNAPRAARWALRGKVVWGRVGDPLEDSPMKAIKAAAKIIGYGAAGITAFVTVVMIYAFMLWLNGGWIV